MRIKVYKNIIFYITIDRMIGYMLMFLSINGAIYHAVFVDGAAGGFGSFLHVPSHGSVLGVGLSITFMNKHTIKDNQLGMVLRKNLFLSGWVVFLVKMVLIGAGMHSEEARELKNLGQLLAQAVLPIIYGITMGIIFETFLTRDPENEQG